MAVAVAVRACSAAGAIGGKRRGPIQPQVGVQQQQESTITTSNSRLCSLPKEVSVSENVVSYLGGIGEGGGGLGLGGKGEGGLGLQTLGREARSKDQCGAKARCVIKQQLQAAACRADGHEAYGSAAHLGGGLAIQLQLLLSPLSW